MRPAQIENWALEIINRVENSQPNEDSRVELKADWINPEKAARQIAGHANSARGEPVLWLVGVDQDHGVVGVDYRDLSAWYASVMAQFDGIAPRMIDINVPCQGKTVVALLFETDRAPFVIRNPAFGSQAGVSIAFEVPWREGTSTRTANRSDLIRLLVPLLNLPEVETLGGELILSVHDRHHWHLKLELYITPQIGVPTVIPFHKCEASVTLPAQAILVDLQMIRLVPPYKPTTGRGAWGLGWEPDSYTAASTQNELILQGPGVVNLSGEAWTDEPPSGLEGSRAEIRIRILPVYANTSILISESLGWVPTEEKGEIGRWKR